MYFLMLFFYFFVLLYVQKTDIIYIEKVNKKDCTIRDESQSNIP